MVVTFAPYPDAARTARVLDRRRLGKQRVECVQILRAVLGVTHGWASHPATRAWLGHPGGLVSYTLSMCSEWRRRGYVDNMARAALDLHPPDNDDAPDWWGHPLVHGSHRAVLHRKLPTHYDAPDFVLAADTFPVLHDRPQTSYVWPTDFARWS